MKNEHKIKQNKKYTRTQLKVLKAHHLMKEKNNQKMNKKNAKPRHNQSYYKVLQNT